MKLGNVRVWLLLGVCGLSGCFVSVHDEYDSEEDEPKSESSPHFGLSGARECTTSEQQATRYTDRATWRCYRDEDFTWRASCAASTCQSVNVYVHYMLTQPIGDAVSVVVEAFDNPSFRGSPVSTVQIHSFDASRPGTYGQTDLYLEPGEYYLRAFVGDESEDLRPYTYRDRELVTDKPVGVFGALSSPAKIIVEPRSRQQFAEPVHMTMDKLFKDPHAGIGTQAFIRVQLSVPDTGSIPADRRVVVQLLHEADIYTAPEVAFAISTERLRVVGSEGAATALSPEVELGAYYVFAYIDANSNEFYDEGEPSQLYSRGGEPYAIGVREKKTTPVALVLSAP